MAVVDAVLTDDAREWWVQMHAGLQTFKPITRFLVGEGGWVDDGVGNKIRRTPDPTLSHLDLIQNPSRYGAGSLDPQSTASFSKNLVLTDFTFTSPSTVEVSCLLDFTDFNDDGHSNSPEIWEIGLFSAWPNFPTGSNPITSLDEMLVAYGTVDAQIKDIGKQIQNVFKLKF